MGAELCAPLNRSCEVLLALHRVLRPRLTLDKHKRLLSTLHARCDASARFWNKGSLGEDYGVLRVLVAGGRGYETARTCSPARWAGVALGGRARNGAGVESAKIGVVTLRFKNARNSYWKNTVPFGNI